MKKTIAVIFIFILININTAYSIESVIGWQSVSNKNAAPPLITQQGGNLSILYSGTATSYAGDTTINNGEYLFAYKNFTIPNNSLGISIQIKYDWSDCIINNANSNSAAILRLELRYETAENFTKVSGEAAASRYYYWLPYQLVRDDMHNKFIEFNIPFSSFKADSTSAPLNISMVNSISFATSNRISSETELNLYIKNIACLNELPVLNADPSSQPSTGYRCNIGFCEDYLSLSNFSFTDDNKFYGQITNKTTAASNGSLILEKDKRMVGYNNYINLKKGESTTVDFSFLDDYSNINAFIWDGFNNIKPLSLKKSLTNENGDVNSSIYFDGLVHDDINSNFLMSRQDIIMNDPVTSDYRSWYYAKYIQPVGITDPSDSRGTNFKGHASTPVEYSDLIITAVNKFAAASLLWEQPKKTGETAQPAVWGKVSLPNSSNVISGYLAQTPMTFELSYISDLGRCIAYLCLTDALSAPDKAIAIAQIEKAADLVLAMQHTGAEGGTGVIPLPFYGYCNDNASVGGSIRSKSKLAYDNYIENKNDYFINKNITDPRFSCSGLFQIEDYDGEIQYDNGDLAEFLYIVYKVTGESKYLGSAEEKTGLLGICEYLKDSKNVHNYNFNAICVRGLMFGYDLSKNYEYFDSAMRKAKIAIYPGIRETSILGKDDPRNPYVNYPGRMIDTHNELNVYHRIIVQGLGAINQFAPKGDLKELNKYYLNLTTQNIVDQINGELGRSPTDIWGIYNTNDSLIVQAFMDNEEMCETWNHASYRLANACISAGQASGFGFGNLIYYFYDIR